MWSAYSEAKKTQVHQEALRGSVPEAVNQQVKEGKERMETLKAELHLLSFYMCRDEPEFVEEEIEIKSGFEGLSITTFDNTTSNYNGPFADREEHIFYTVVPKLEELLPSLHLKRGKKTDSDTVSDDVSDSDSEFEDEAKIEDEMKRLDAELPAGATMEEDDEEDALVSHSASERPATSKQSWLMSKSTGLSFSAPLETLLSSITLFTSALRRSVSSTIMLHCSVRLALSSPVISRTVSA